MAIHTCKAIPPVKTVVGGCVVSTALGRRNRVSLKYRVTVYIVMANHACKAYTHL